MSVLCYALLQRKLLAITGYRVNLWSLLGLSIATDAIADSLPGEPVFSSAFRFRQYQRHGVDATNAAWVMITVLVALALGLSILLLLGVLISVSFGGHHQSEELAVLAIIVLGLMLIVLTRISLWLRVIRLGLRLNRLLPQRFEQRITPALLRAQRVLAELHLGIPSSLLIGLLGLAEWGFDLGCLILIFPALDVRVPWVSVILGYAASQIIGVIPITPGGLGTIEGSLSGVLIAFGTAARHAITSVLVYRLISYWLIIPIGWLAFLAITITARRAGRDRSAAGDPPKACDA